MTAESGGIATLFNEFSRSFQHKLIFFEQQFIFRWMMSHLRNLVIGSTTTSSILVDFEELEWLGHGETSRICKDDLDVGMR
jgi:hypothetical protein